MMAETFEVYAPKTNTLLLGGLGLLMTALSALPLWLSWQGEAEAWIMVPIGIVGLGFFGLATFVALSHLVFPKPVLRVDEIGVHVWRYPTLEWAMFDYADAASSSREVFLVLHSHDNDAFRDRMIWYRKLWARANAALVEGAVYLSQRLLPGTAQELADRINAAADKHIG